MDLSGMIFIALAIGWAVYLIPKALQQHEELARSRSVERFSTRMRVFAGRQPVTSEVAPEAPAAPESEAVIADAPVVRRPVTRAAARRAAARRRRVLYVLTGVLVVVAAAAFLSYLPRWSVAVPVVLIIGFLVIARLTVRLEQAIATPRRATAPAVDATTVVTAEPAAAADTEDTVGLARADLESQQALADEGSLWDPLPMTLPTYVSKPQVRRTVRTIEITQPRVTSSGHDPADSKLVRDAEAVEAAQAATDDAGEQRRAAGA